jgi:hypothetical protein
LRIETYLRGDGIRVVGFPRAWDLEALPSWDPFLEKLARDRTYSDQFSAPFFLLIQFHFNPLARKTRRSSEKRFYDRALLVTGTGQLT